MKFFSNLYDDNEEGYFEPFEFTEIDNLDFDKDKNILIFNLLKVTVKPKITRYKTINYERFPIYGGKSVSTKKIYSMNKTIKNLQKYLNNEFFEFTKKYNLEEDLIDEIVEEIGVSPEWWIIKKQIDKLSLEIRDFNKEKREIKPHELLRENYPTKKCSLILRLLFMPFTLGLSFIGYRSKRKNEKNRIKNEKNKSYNDEFINTVNNDNTKLQSEIETNNNKINQEIIHLQDNLNKIIKSTVVNNFDDFENIRDILNNKFDLNNLKESKGVYIIWNKTKNKYYVGQTKNLYKRIFTQHFNLKNCDVKNIIFAKDWFDNDEFFLKTIKLETKDELDNTEKHYIDMYDSFKNGYNSTSGNI